MLEPFPDGSAGANQPTANLVGVSSLNLAESFANSLVWKEPTYQHVVQGKFCYGPCAPMIFVILKRTNPIMGTMWRHFGSPCQIKQLSKHLPEKQELLGKVVLLETEQKVQPASKARKLPPF